ncbi:hypothetical protein P175DRAFT_0479995 [Aspergillus ochraceoroseus IBT 24754]|uniref:Uncharacterized protein n=1 Tax=Aspergillus ochraceoroseus IBT 24754 TaxID=1392256 RepID=A0A2T5LY23_9EURO|nr:uncharacterized protein P175DRAFT_0479995 [Aspergillus ochraceoroseus IBT 24754]PTU21188.1 hypothetical protein P175DRAFT_0479995 [Aspergillus ochraceoroseus IBT 24754]
MPSSPASGSKPEKTMSSRLLTMKFMQRAAASKEASQPASAKGSNAPTPKKVRLSTGPPESPVTPSSDLEAISAALAVEENKRREAISRQAAEAGETEWVIDFGAADAVNQYAQQPLVLTDYSLDADDDDMNYGGRQAYGNFKRKNKAKVHTAEESESEEDEDGDLADPENIDAMINKAKNKASKKEKNKHQTGHVRLSQLTSISGGRHGTVGGSKPQKKRKHK